MPKEVAYLFDPNIGKYYYGKISHVFFIDFNLDK
jgi:hypothetical protein